MKDAAARAAALAVHRFGLGEATLAVAGDDPRGWLDAQIGAADLQPGASALQALAVQADEQRRRRSGQAVDDRPLRELVQADIRGHLVAAATTARPFAERLALFWSNHFTVSVVKGGVRGLAGAFEREAIRPHIAGPFATLLKAAVTHPAMLRYLDNDHSAGPNSRIVALARRRAGRNGEPPRVTGLNENLAREVLELHTLGVGGGYTQADVGAEWLGPDALWKRVEWASRAARRLGAAADARALDRAAGGAQALALLMLAPEAMRRWCRARARTPRTRRACPTLRAGAGCRRAARSRSPARCRAHSQ